MRVESTVYQNPDHHNNQGARSRPRGSEEGFSYERFSQDETEELNPLIAEAEKHLAEEQEARLRLADGLSEDLKERLLRKVQEAIEEMNHSAEINFVSLRFQLHEEADRWMVQIIDVMEDEVLRVIPPEELLDLAGQIQKLTGVLVDARR